MSEHTPGPWAASLGDFSFTNAGQRAVITLTSDDAEPIHIAYVSAIAERKRNTPYDAPDPEREANARLIAAAPDLLWALTQIIHDLPTNLDWLDRNLEAAARAAIAAATGETP